MSPDKIPAIPERRSVKLRTIDGRVTIANFAVPTGRFGSVRVIEICNVPDYVTDREVCRIYESTVDLSDVLEHDFVELGNGSVVLA